MPRNATEQQRELVRALYQLHNGDESSICSAYARAELEGRVFRDLGDYNIPPEAYAQALLSDGRLKGWLAPATSYHPATDARPAPPVR